MDDPEFHTRYLMRVGELLGMDRPFRVRNCSDPRDHIWEIVYACREYRDQAAAVTALAASMRDLREDAEALVRLEECADAINGLSALSTDQLVSALEVITRMSGKYSSVGVLELARRVALYGEGVPLRWTESLPDVVRRLNGARVTVPVKVPLVVRFLAGLASSIGGDDGLRVAAEVRLIADELNLSLEDVGLGSSDVLGAHEKILQIRVEDISAPGSPLYTIDAAVFGVVSGERQLIRSWQCHKGCRGHNIDDTGRRLVELFADLSGDAGTGKGVVEFLLPWSLLGYPVDWWGCDEVAIQQA